LIPILYENVLNDDDLKVYFKELDTNSQIKACVDFCKAFLGKHNRFMRSDGKLPADLIFLKMGMDDVDKFLSHFKTSLLKIVKN